MYYHRFLQRNQFREPAAAGHSCHLQAKASYGNPGAKHTPKFRYISKVESVCQRTSIYALPTEIQTRLLPKTRMRSFMPRQSNNQKNHIVVTVAHSKQLFSQEFTSFHHCMALNILLHWTDHHVKQTVIHFFKPQTKYKNRLFIKKR